MTAGASATAAAPGRVNLIGEHLDYLGGRCLSLALERRTTATVTLRDDDRLRVRSGRRTWHGSVVDLVPGAVPGWPAYAAGVLWALDVRRGVDVDIDSDLPSGAGLSSSAALASAVALALDAVLGLGLSREELAETAYRAESGMVGAPTGRLDQLVSLVADPGRALLVDFAGGRPTRESLPCRPDAAGLALLVVDTRVSHDMRVGGYGERRAECEEAARRLGVRLLADAVALPGLAERLAGLPDLLARRARFVTEEVARVGAVAAALRAGDWDALGPLLDAGHAGARDDLEISCPELDLAVTTARGAGAVAARMTGGGFGGSAVALVPVGSVDRVGAALAEAFVERGWREPHVFPTAAGRGAQVLRRGPAAPPA
ncbi:galactokinase [Nocardioides aurantiacus]|uniref:Galactokinase n=1 Tax=Nocardioides aurantiacus TaxID=86796 RepID=A0A3N2CSP8_9ACTN|nr:galactokinase family protein [Nocardioides aurantiacus]ROR90264.1 galactokinase [Nocardioides aurantiacus]